MKMKDANGRPIIDVEDHIEWLEDNAELQPTRAGQYVMLKIAGYLREEHGIKKDETES